ncbi:hypothetical protein BBP40_002176 [Aspergillus hancockii]|nr:hypothetical protein BBP40_002176 [Aspergillus hancockii]
MSPSSCRIPGIDDQIESETDIPSDPLPYELLLQRPIGRITRPKSRTTSEANIDNDIEGTLELALLFGNSFMTSHLLQHNGSLDQDRYERYLRRVPIDEEDPKLLKHLVKEGQQQISQDVYFDAVTSALAVAVFGKKVPSLEVSNTIIPCNVPRLRGIVAALVEAHADLRALEGVERTWEPIHAAADNVDVFRSLLNPGHQIDINVRCSNGSTALMLVAKWGYEMCIVELLRHGADMRPHSDYGQSFLSFVIEKFNGSMAYQTIDQIWIPCVRWLTKEINSCSTIVSGIAVQENNLRIAEYLASYNAVSNTCVGELGTPLHLAFYQNSLAMIEMLVSKRAGLRDVPEDSPHGAVFQAACRV